MLREITMKLKRGGDQVKRWFSDEYWDLHRWYNDTGGDTFHRLDNITRFRLVFGKPADECLPKLMRNLEVEGIA